MQDKEGIPPYFERQTVGGWAYLEWIHCSHRAPWYQWYQWYHPRQWRDPSGATNSDCNVHSVHSMHTFYTFWMLILYILCIHSPQSTLHSLQAFGLDTERRELSQIIVNVLFLFFITKSVWAYPFIHALMACGAKFTRPKAEGICCRTNLAVSAWWLVILRIQLYSDKQSKTKTNTKQKKNTFIYRCCSSIVMGRCHKIKIKIYFLNLDSRGRWNRTTELLYSYRFEVCTPHQWWSSTHILVYSYMA